MSTDPPERLPPIFVHDNVPATGDDFRPSHRSIYVFDMPTMGEPWEAPEKLADLNRMSLYLEICRRLCPEVIPGWERYCGFARVKIHGLHMILAIDTDEGRAGEVESATPDEVTERVGGKPPKLDLLNMRIETEAVVEEGADE